MKRYCKNCMKEVTYAPKRWSNWESVWWRHVISNHRHCWDDEWKNIARPDKETAVPVDVGIFVVQGERAK